MMAESSNKTIKGLRCKVEYFDDGRECYYEPETNKHFFIGEPYNIIIIISSIDKIIDIKRSIEPNLNFTSESLCGYDRIFFHPIEEIEVSVSFVKDCLRYLEENEKIYQKLNEKSKSVLNEEIDLILNRIKTNLNKIEDQTH